MIRNVKRKTEIFLDLPGCRRWLNLTPFFLQSFSFFPMGQPDDQATRHPFTVSDHKCHGAFGLIRQIRFSWTVTGWYSRWEWAIQSGSSEARHRMLKNRFENHLLFISCRITANWPLPKIEFGPTRQPRNTIKGMKSFRLTQSPRKARTGGKIVR